MIQHIKMFVGWVAILVGTWLIATSARQFIVEHISSTSPATFIALGVVIIIFAIVIFGKKAPWL